MQPASGAREMKTVRQAANVSSINFCIFTKLSSLSLGFVIASLMSPSAFSDWLYVLDQEDDSLVRIDPDSFETVVVGPVGFNVRFGGMTWHPELRKLLVANDEQGSVDQPTIYSIDVDTGLSEQLGNVDVGTTNSSSSYGLAYDEISGGVVHKFCRRKL